MFGKPNFTCMAPFLPQEPFFFYFGRIIRKLDCWRRWDAEREFERKCVCENGGKNGRWDRLESFFFPLLFASIFLLVFLAG